MTSPLFLKLSLKLTLLGLFVFLTIPSSFATEKCGNLLLLPIQEAWSVTLRLSLSSCEELANAVELSFSIPPHLSFRDEDILLENLYKLPSEHNENTVTFRYVSLDDLSGVHDIADFHFDKVSGGDTLPTLLPESLILLSDGKGTNIFSMK
jgi:hypothetical protein